MACWLAGDFPDPTNDTLITKVGQKKQLYIGVHKLHL